MEKNRLTLPGYVKQRELVPLGSQVNLHTRPEGGSPDLLTAAGVQQ